MNYSRIADQDINLEEEILEREDPVARKISDAFYTVCVLFLVEGALRKWVFPQFSSPLFFLKDPFVLYIYFLSFRPRRTPSNPLFHFTILLSIILMVFVLIQVFLINYEVYVGLYGWRNYCLYAPLPFIIEKYLKEKDVLKIAKTICLSSIPMSLLGFYQYQSPSDSYINRSVGEGGMAAFTVARGIVRATGTFSFTTSFSLYIPVLLFFILYNYFLGKRAFLKPWMFYASIFSFFLCLAVSGSRGAYFNVLLIVAFVLVASMFQMNKKSGFNIIWMVIIAALVSAFFFQYVFDEQWEIIKERQEMASGVEGSIWKRILSVFLDVEFLLLFDLSLLGSGIGLGSGGGSYLASGSVTGALAESEYVRHLIEAGVLMGLLYIVYRISLAVYIFSNAIKALLRTSNPIPLIFCGFTLPNIIVGSITGNGGNYSFTWIFLSIHLAIIRIYINKEFNQIPKKNNLHQRIN